MRLGDLDALYEEVADHVTSVSVCATAQQAIGQTDFKWRCLEDIRNAPTIDAIPVEWLQDMARRTVTQAEPHFAFMYVLHEWQEAKPIEVQQAESEEEAFQIASDAAMSGGSWDFYVKPKEG